MNEEPGPVEFWGDTTYHPAPPVEVDTGEEEDRQYEENVT